MEIRVEDVMNKKVVTIESDYSAKYAAKVMSSLRISSLVVKAGTTVVGILTERDLVSRVVAKGLDPEKVLICDVMSQPVVIVSPNIPLEKAVLVMLTRHIKKLPVMAGKNKERLVGILSLTDIAKLHPSIYARMKELDQALAPEPISEEVDFYIR